MILLSRQLRARSRVLGGVSLPGLGRFAARAMRAACCPRPVTFLLAGEGEMRALNRRFRGKDRTTDVLSFPDGNGSGGDIAISVSQARRQARGRGHATEAEIKILMLHGILHLVGMNHECDGGRMQAQEERLRRALGLPDGIIARSAAASTPHRPIRSGRRRGGRSAGKP